MSRNKNLGVNPTNFLSNSIIQTVRQTQGIDITKEVVACEQLVNVCCENVKANKAESNGNVSSIGAHGPLTATQSQRVFNLYNGTLSESGRLPRGKLARLSESLNVPVHQIYGCRDALFEEGLLSE